MAQAGHRASLARRGSRPREQGLCPTCGSRKALVLCFFYQVPSQIHDLSSVSQHGGSRTGERVTQVGSVGQVPQRWGWPSAVLLLLLHTSSPPMPPHASLGLAQGSPAPITGLGDPTVPTHPDYDPHHVEPVTYLRGSLILS